ncbi:UNVERIFIED_CONTAM: hypothetical protein PYX00_007578 [Menopon gallinae]|uniref:Uncharacterized protein n=1 Tax=Menopon gallinae TaxID=328185 RepID=A0AAW2HJK0_9NEOP
MNLTIAMILTQNLGSVENTDWTVNTITKISNQYFRTGGDFFIFHYYVDQPEDFIMERVIKNLSETKKFIITYYNCTMNYEEPSPFLKPKGILLFIEFSKHTYTDNLNDFHQKIMKNINLELRVIVVLQHHKYVKDNDILFLLERSWNFNIRNVLVINSVVTDHAPAAIKLFHWQSTFDFKRDSGIKMQNVKKMTLSVQQKVGAFNIALQNGTQFEVTNAEDIRGHFLNISVAITPPYVWLNADRETLIGKQIENLTTDLVDGLEISILREFQKKYNLSGNFIIHSPELDDMKDIKDENNENYDSEYSALEETAFGTSDIAIGGAIASEELYSFFGVSAVYFQDDMDLYVQDAREIPRWKNLYLMFNYRIWIFIGAVHVLASITIYLKVRSGRFQNGEIDFSTAMLTAWGTILSQSLPRTVPDKMRLFFFACLAYGMHISTFYQSGLITVINQKFYIKPIRTIEEAREANMTVCLSSITYDYYDSDSIHEQLEYSPETIAEPNYTTCLDRVTVDRNIMALVPHMTTEYTIPLQYIDANHRKKITGLTKRLISFPVSMYLKKASPYKKPLDFVIRGLIEFGFITKWWDDIRASTVYKRKGWKKFTAQEYVSISLKNVMGVFSIFLLFTVISIAVFIAELTWFKFSQWRTARRLRRNGVNKRFIH